MLLINESVQPTPQPTMVDLLMAVLGKLEAMEKRIVELEKVAHKQVTLEDLWKRYNELDRVTIPNQPLGSPNWQPLPGAWPTTTYCAAAPQPDVSAPTYIGGGGGPYGGGVYGVGGGGFSPPNSVLGDTVNGYSLKDIFIC